MKFLRGHKIRKKTRREETRRAMSVSPYHKNKNKRVGSFPELLTKLTISSLRLHFFITVLCHLQNDIVNCYLCFRPSSWVHVRFWVSTIGVGTPPPKDLPENQDNRIGHCGEWYLWLQLHWNGKAVLLVLFLSTSVAKCYFLVDNFWLLEEANYWKNWSKIFCQNFPSKMLLKCLKNVGAHVISLKISEKWLIT